MTKYTRSLYAASAASTNDLAHIDVLVNSTLVAVDMSIDSAVPTAADRLALELSTASVAQSTTNDAQGILAITPFTCATAVGQFSANNFKSPMSIFIPAGTRIFLHTTQTGTTSTRCRATLHLVS